MAESRDQAEVGTRTRAGAGERAGIQESLGAWLLHDPRARLIVGLLVVNLAANLVDLVPVLGPVAELVADLGAESVAFLLAALVLERGGGKLRALLPFALVGILKIALNGLNLIPGLGSVLETFSEGLLGVLQLWILKRAAEAGARSGAGSASGSGRPPGAAPGGGPVIDVTPLREGRSI